MTSTGYQLRQPHIPLVPGYAVLGFDEDDETGSRQRRDGGEHFVFGKMPDHVAASFSNPARGS